MRATEPLKEEHRVIESVLGVLGRICDRLGSGLEVNPAHLEQVLTFIAEFADKCHHGKEEELLFPALEEAGIPREGGPIGVMLMEHETARGYVRDLREAVARYRAGDGGASAKIVESARGYIELLSQHIFKEENVLFAMADPRLSEAKQEELLEGFERVENERLGPGKHEELRRLADRLREAYPS